MVKNYTTKRLSSIGKIILCGVLSLAGLLSIGRVFAINPTNISVNGTNIYNGSEYSSVLESAGVSYDIGSNTLTLENANITNITANGDLIINLVGSNTIDNTSDSGVAIEAFFPPNPTNLTIKGEDGASLTINSNDRAILLSGAGLLTIGDSGDLSNHITVTIETGENRNIDTTTVIDGSTYNYTPPAGPGGPGDPSGPPPGAPVKISINGDLVIDETADPPLTSASEDNWTLSKNDFGGWDLSIDNSSDSSIGFISGEGDGMLSICPTHPELTIEADLVSGYSIDFAGEMFIGTCGGEDPSIGVMNINLEGGIFTQSAVNIGEGKNLNIGSAEHPSPEGITAFEVKVSPKEGYEELKIFTTGTALQFWDETPPPEEGMQVIAENKGKLTIVQSGDATSNVKNILVQSGGEVDIHYAGTLGIFTPQAAHWTWGDLTSMNGVERPPIIVTAETDADEVNKYTIVLDAEAKHFNLKSTANAMAGVGFFLVSNDSNGISPRIPAEKQIQHGFIEIMAARGYRTMPGGIYWEDEEAGIIYEDYGYSIEVGSEVSIKMLPDYGYQFVSGSINGIPLSPDDARASYIFTMPSSDIQLSAIFEKTDDIIAVNSNAIAGASIEMPTGEINGTAEFTVADDTSVNKAAFEEAAGGSTIGGLVELSLNEVVYKGSSDAAWKTSITDLNNEMKVNLTLAEDLKGYTDYIVLRNHNGVITKLPATYNSSTGVLSFSTDAYSTYAIAHGAPATNPNTYDGIIKHVAIGIASLLGLCSVAVYLKYRQKSH